MNNIQDQPQEPGKCQHSGCMCEAPDGNYCSEYCENAIGGEVGQGCQCGHTDCAE
jgi:hypothetical protein